jgi:polysaccharide biosynthesis protein PelD
MTDPLDNPASDLGQRHIAGVRVSAMLEAIAFLALAVLVDVLFGEGDRFAAVQPHPFWVLVLLMAAFYGTNEGLAAALLAAVALLVGNLPEQGFDEDRSTWLLRVSADPVLWVLAAIVIGEIRGGHQRAQAALESKLREAQQEVAAISGAYRKVVSAKSNLEVRVAAQAQTVHAIYKASRAIERHSTGDVLVGIIDLVRAVLDPTKFSVFLLNGSTLEAAASLGWSASDALSRDFDEGSPLFEAVVRCRQTLVVANSTQEAILSCEGVLAGPIVSSESGAVVGMLKIEEIGFAGLTPGSIQNFQILCEWIGTAFDNAQRLESLTGGSELDVARELLPRAHYDRQRSVITALAEQLGLDASAVFLRVDAGEDASEHQEALIKDALARVSGQVLSRSDLPFDFRSSGWSFIILMLNANLTTSRAVAERLTVTLQDDLHMRGLEVQSRYFVEPLRPAPPDLRAVGAP